MIMALSGILAPQVVKGLLNNFCNENSIRIVGVIIYSGFLGSIFFYASESESGPNLSDKNGIDEVDATHRRINSTKVREFIFNFT